MNFFSQIFLCLLLSTVGAPLFAHSNAEIPDPGTLDCSIDGPTTFIRGTTHTYTIDSDGDDTDYKFFWSVTGNLSIVGNNDSEGVDVTASSSGNGTVCVTRFKEGEEPCCDCLDVTVESPPCVPATSIDLSQIEISGNGCPGDVVKFNLTVQPSGVSPGSILWQAGTGFIGSNIFFTQNGGLSANIETPSNNFGVWVRVTFTSCDGSQLTALTFVTWEDNCLKGEDFPGKFKATDAPSLQPNPFSESTVLQYRSLQEQEAQLDIFDQSGALVHTQSLRFISGDNQVKLDQLPAKANGILYYQLKSDQALLGTGKMLRTK